MLPCLIGAVCIGVLFWNYKLLPGLPTDELPPCPGTWRELPVPM
jgi:hypothetical protein